MQFRVAQNCQSAVTVAKTDAVDPVTVGEEVSYTITLNNNSANPITAVHIVDQIPDSLRPVVLIDAIGDCDDYAVDGQTLTCPIALLAPGASAEVPVRATAIAAGEVSNVASVSFTVNGSQKTLRSEQTTTIQPRTARLMITKTDDQDPVLVGDTFNYIITVTNNGPDAATDVAFSDTLAVGLTPLEAPSGDCNFDAGLADNTVSCTFGTIAPGASKQATFLTKATTTEPPTTVINEVTVSTASDNTSGQSSAVEETTILPAQVDLTVIKVDSVDTVKVAERFDYRVTVRNEGPNTAKNVRFSDSLPQPQLRTVSLPTGDCGNLSMTATSIGCSLGDIAPTGDFPSRSARSRYDRKYRHCQHRLSEYR